MLSCVIVAQILRERYRDKVADSGVICKIVSRILKSSSKRT